MIHIRDSPSQAKILPFRSSSAVRNGSGPVASSGRRSTSGLPAKGTRIGIAFSGGLDTRCAVAWLAEQGLEVHCYTADLAQPDEKDCADIPPTWRYARLRVGSVTEPTTSQRAHGAADQASASPHRGPGLLAHRKVSMASDIASRPLMRVVDPVSQDEVAAAERWHQWQVRNAVASRIGARRARIAFAIMFAGLGVWLGVQLLNPTLWP